MNCSTGLVATHAIFGNLPNQTMKTEFFWEAHVQTISTDQPLRATLCTSVVHVPQKGLACGACLPWPPK
jgi:hypothetical protein